MTGLVLFRNDRQMATWKCSKPVWFNVYNYGDGTQTAGIANYRRFEGRYRKDLLYRIKVTFK